jgi:AcrR family transcriptional regulator
MSVTKGSFYHHFTDRDALWAAILERFEHEGTEVIVGFTAAITDPRLRLTSLFAAAFERPDRLRASRALLGSRRSDVAGSLVRVHARRRAWLVTCYRELGLSAQDAESRAATAYALFLGAVMLADQPPFADADTLHAWVHDLGPLLLANDLGLPPDTRTADVTVSSTLFPDGSQQRMGEPPAVAGVPGARR